ncbi:MAG TPA: hypothetical protein PLU17_07415 [Chitinophagaceae bacterium]|nr:hypothetical protein [Chitinophagaceae bacterium]
MKKIFFAVACILVFNIEAVAQVPYNPFVQTIHYAPEPTPSGFECGSINYVQFTQGITTIDDAPLWQTEPLRVQICVEGFLFNGPADSVVTGSYSHNFDWAYDSINPGC